MFKPKPGECSNKGHMGGFTPLLPLKLSILTDPPGDLISQHQCGLHEGKTSSVLCQARDFSDLLRLSPKQQHLFPLCAVQLLAGNTETCPHINTTAEKEEGICLRKRVFNQETRRDKG